MVGKRVITLILCAQDLSDRLLMIDVTAAEWVTLSPSQRARHWRKANRLRSLRAKRVRNREWNATQRARKEQASVAVPVGDT